MTLKKQSYKDRNGQTCKSAKWYADFRDHRGVRRALSLFTDKKNAVEAARAIERLVGIRASSDIVPQELQRFIENTRPDLRQKLVEWSIVEPIRAASAKDLEQHIGDWRRSMDNRGRSSEAHISLISGRVCSLFKACKFVTWSNVDAEPLSDVLARWRSREKRPLSVQTSNFYLQNAKQFCRWMVANSRASANPLMALTSTNVASDRRHDRRAFSLEEFNWLLGYLNDAPVRMGLSSTERLLLYRFAAETGLRRGGIAKLTKASFRLGGDPPSVHVPAGASNKYKHARDLPLRTAMVEMLAVALAEKEPNDAAFRLPPRQHNAKVLKADLDAARAAWIEAGTMDERQQRAQSDFLRYKSARNEFLDFHAFRHTRGVWLFEHFDAKPREVQELMGLSSLALVDRYGRSYKVNGREFVERGPELKPSLIPPMSVVASPVGNQSPVLPRSLPRSIGPGSIPTDADGQSGIVTGNAGSQQDGSENRPDLDILTPNAGSDIISLPPGEVAEWLNAPVSKTG